VPVDNFAAVLDFHADRSPAKVVLTDGEREFTNADLLARVNALAQVLLDLGIGRGDVVGLLLYNRAEFIETVFAVNRIGAVFLPLNYRLAPAEWEYILGHGQVKLLVTETDFQPAVDGIAARLPDLTARLLVGDAVPSGWGDYAALVRGRLGARVPVVDVAGDELQRLMYTSGTTSRPKGVCISHRNVMYKNLGLFVQFGWNADQVTAVAGPLYHVGALDMGGLATLHAGGSLVLQTKFEPKGLIELIARRRPTTIWLAPAMVNAVLQCEAELSRADISSLKLILSGGEKMPEARLKQVLDLFPGLWFADAYGLTETVSSDTFMPFDQMRAKLGSVGRPLPHVRVRVIDDDGDDVPADRIGEIAVRGPKVFSGYWRDPEATAACFQHGWFRTGDMGRLDPDGFLYIEDRKKDMIVSGGENIATPEIERVLYEHPGIVEAAVIGHPDERWGEVPHAYVVPRPGTRLTAEELVAFCLPRLAKFKVPKYFDIIDALPRTPSGKVLKRHLRQPPEGGQRDIG
jgi:acyl-CoA synthetase (AMP-forming)/AMP-acid ligase II